MCSSKRGELKIQSWEFKCKYDVPTYKSGLPLKTQQNLIKGYLQKRFFDKLQIHSLG